MLQFGKLLGVTLLICMLPMHGTQNAANDRITTHDNGDGTYTQVRPGHILFGGPREIIKVGSASGCEKICRDKTFCKSAVFYKTDKECLLYVFTGEEPGRGGQILHAPPEDAVDLIQIITQEPRTPKPNTNSGQGGGDILILSETAPLPRPRRRPVDRYSQCCEWAKKGECDSNMVWMRTNCQRSCGTPGATSRTASSMKVNIPRGCKASSGSSLKAGCQPDMSSHCRTWAASGECQRNPFWMKPRCQESCNSCGATSVDAGARLPPEKPGCQNVHESCNFWASENECDTNPTYMRPNCCHACSNINLIKSLSR